MLRMKKRTWLIILIILVVIQFIQPSKNNGSALAATDITHVVAVPDSVMGILKKACFDCHSNYTRYPWYSRITPVNWWLNNHIHEGKEALNFTTFGSYPQRKMAKKLDETAEMVEKGRMPLPSYLWIHKDAKLTEQEKDRLILWADQASQQLGGGGAEKD